MAIQAGNFSASDLVATILRADKMWSDNMMKADFTANVDVFKAIREEQNATTTLFSKDGKKNWAKVFWVNACGDSGQACSNDDCDISGPELGSDSKEYQIGECYEYKFSVNEMKFRDNFLNVEDVIAKGFLKADKWLSEKVTAITFGKLNAAKGTNVVTNGIGTVNAVTSETDIADANWNSRLFAYLYRIAIQNQFTNPFLLSGSNLWEENIVAKLNGANQNGKGDAALYKLMRTKFDLFNIDVLNAPDLKTYMVNRGALAFASVNYYDAKPVKYKMQDRWSIASRNLVSNGSPVRFDVYYTNRCSGNDIIHDFKVVVNFDVFLNPTGCDAGRTGVLAFNRV